jgi:hypothetical protein
MVEGATHADGQLTGAPCMSCSQEDWHFSKGGRRSRAPFRTSNGRVVSHSPYFWPTYKTCCRSFLI